MCHGLISQEFEHRAAVETPKINTAYCDMRRGGWQLICKDIETPFHPESDLYNERPFLGGFWDFFWGGGTASFKPVPTLALATPQRSET